MDSLEKNKPVEKEKEPVKEEQKPVKFIISGEPGKCNSRNNLINGIQTIKKEIGCRCNIGYEKEFNFKTGDIFIKYHTKYGLSVEIRTCNARCSSRIHINQYDISGTLVLFETHFFNSSIFPGYVNELLTPAELEQQRAFKQQQQERKDALENAHDARNCDKDCEHCKNDRQLDSVLPCRGSGSYT
jgi:hypothetical protein